MNIYEDDGEKTTYENTNKYNALGCVGAVFATIIFLFFGALIENGRRNR